MIAAAIAGVPGEPVRLTHARPDHLGEQFVAAFRETGAVCTIADNEVIVTPSESIKPVSIKTAIYPGFPTDLQAQWTVLLA